MIKRTLSLTAILLVLAAGTNTTHGQDTTGLKKPTVEFSGFLRLDYFVDTRLNSESLDGLFIFYPLPVKPDENGNDINAAGGVNFLAMATRLRTNIAMPGVFNAKPSVLIEADFTGLSNNVHMRFRHAFAKFSWDSGSELNLGLTWHPMFVTEVFPYVASLNTGAPFQSFYRSPQITFKQSFSSFKLILSAITQSDNRNVGPDAPAGSSKLLRHAMVPNLHAQLQFASGPITAGVAADYKNLRPLLSVKSLNQVPAREYVTNERIVGLSYMAYLKYQSGMFTAKFKGMYGQNLSEHLLLGGYAVSAIDSLTGSLKYTPVNHAFAYANFTYGKSFMPGIFLGYAKNLGASSNVVPDSKRVYGRGMDIDYLYRISPNVTIRRKNFSVMGEVEYTVASTGQIDVSGKAKVANGRETANTRFLVMIQYDF